MTRRFIGGFTAEDPPPCVGRWEERRRKDIPPAKYGNGIPEFGSINYDPWGIPEKYMGDYETIATEQGPINLPLGTTSGYDQTFLPSPQLLQTLPFIDSRRPLISDRFYR